MARQLSIGFAWVGISHRKEYKHLARNSLNYEHVRGIVQSCVPLGGTCMNSAGLELK